MCQEESGGHYAEENYQINLENYYINIQYIYKNLIHKKPHLIFLTIGLRMCSSKIKCQDLLDSYSGREEQTCF